MIKAKLVLTDDNGHMDCIEIECASVDVLRGNVERFGYKFDGVEDGRHRRAELQGMPRFAGLAGPMWDGVVIRYEDWRTYARLCV